MKPKNEIGGIPQIICLNFKKVLRSKVELKHQKIPFFCV
ncbi:hypothetical protein bcf_09300 [Bacillus cereus F837/76]|nr:hypothetical protein bcf_09300 [Bacillus cereus F837/76]